MAHDFVIKTFSDERAYHNTAILIYLKAVHSVFKDADVTIGNSLNQGYYSYINLNGAKLTTSDIHKIRDKMEKYIAKDYEVAIEHENPEGAIEIWKRYRCNEKIRLLEGRRADEDIEIANIHNYRGYMYCKLLPSTGYINLFDIRPYRNGLLLRLPNALHIIRFLNTEMMTNSMKPMRNQNA